MTYQRLCLAIYSWSASDNAGCVEREYRALLALSAFGSLNVLSGLCCLIWLGNRLGYSLGGLTSARIAATFAIVAALHFARRRDLLPERQKSATDARDLTWMGNVYAVASVLVFIVTALLTIPTLQ
jgi:hypothetical protein